MTLQLRLHAVTLLSFLVFNDFGRMNNRSVKIISVDGSVTCDSGSELESGKFYRLQL